MLFLVIIMVVILEHILEDSNSNDKALCNNIENSFRVTKTYKECLHLFRLEHYYHLLGLVELSAQNRFCLEQPTVATEKPAALQEDCKKKGREIKNSNDSASMHMEIRIHLWLDWGAWFMQPDFLSTKEFAVAGLGVESITTTPYPLPPRRWFALCCCWASPIYHLRQNSPSPERKSSQS